MNTQSGILLKTINDSVVLVVIIIIIIIIVITILFTFIYLYTSNASSIAGGELFLTIISTESSSFHQS